MEKKESLNVAFCVVAFVDYPTQSHKCIETTLLDSEEFQSVDSGIQKAHLLIEKYHLSKQQILEAGICSRQSFARRNIALRNGRDIGRNGHPKNLSDADERFLPHWISELIDQDEAMRGETNEIADPFRKNCNIL